MSDSMDQLINLLHKERCSCVIRTGDRITVCRERGVKDLFRLLKEEPEILTGASVADKVIGKGAAVLMVKGGVSRVYADVISRPALSLLELHGIDVEYDRLTDNIINRQGTGICPVETLTMHCDNLDECVAKIEGFIKSMNK